MEGGSLPVGNRPRERTLPADPAPQALPPWWLGASLLAHVVLVALLQLLTSDERPVIQPVVRSIAVEILTPEEFDATFRPPTADDGELPPPEIVEEQPDRPAPSYPEPPPPPPPGGLIQAERILSTAVLADPRSAKARTALFGLSPDERIIQLCNAEALEQVRVWSAEFRPDFLVAYAMDELELSDYGVKADGGAFRSRHRWFEIRFECEVVPDLSEVATFAFEVGDEIPRSEWESHSLTADDAGEPEPPQASPVGSGDNP